MKLSIVLPVSKIFWIFIFLCKVPLFLALALKFLKVAFLILEVERHYTDFLNTNFFLEIHQHFILKHRGVPKYQFLHIWYEKYKTVDPAVLPDITPLKKNTLKLQDQVKTRYY